MFDEMKDTSNAMDYIPEVDETVVDDAVAEENIALSEFTDEEIQEYEEGALSGKEKAKFLLLTPLATTIIKFCLIGLGLIGAILWIVGLVAPNSLNGFYTGYVSVLAAINNIMPFSVFEILIVLIIVGWLGYLVYVLVRFFQVFKNGKLLASRMWIQFGYSTLALVMVLTMLFSFGYGIVGGRSSFHKASTSAEGVPLYTNNKVKETELSETLGYMIDKLNTTVINANVDTNNQQIVFSTKTGLSKYNVKGNKNTVLAKAVSDAFQNAAKEIPALKGPKVNVKEMIAGPMYNSMNIGSMYAPLTGEVLINPYFPSVSVPMLVAKGIAKQRGFQSDAQADMIAYLVCTRYSDNPYVQYSAYFNAYVSIGGKLAKRNMSTYATMASALKEEVKKEVIAYTRKLDSLYGNKSSLQFTDNGTGATASAYYLEYPELIINYYRQKLAMSADNTQDLNCGYYVNSLVDLYRQDVNFQTEIENVVAKYSEYKITKVPKDTVNKMTAEEAAAAGIGESTTTTTETPAE